MVCDRQNAHDNNTDPPSPASPTLRVAPTRPLEAPCSHRMGAREKRQQNQRQASRPVRNCSSHDQIIRGDAGSPENAKIKPSDDAQGWVRGAVSWILSLRDAYFRCAARGCVYIYWNNINEQTLYCRATCMIRTSHHVPPQNMSTASILPVFFVGAHPKHAEASTAARLPQTVLGAHAL